MDIDGERDALIKLLQRALRSVPFVKLDAVDDVMALFESGLNLLEANLIDIADLPTSTTTSSHPFSASDSISSSLLSSSSSDDGSSGRRSALSLNVPSGHPFRDPLVSPGGTESAASLMLRDDHDDVDSRTNSNHQSINAAQAITGKALDESAIKTVANRALLGVTVTRDYSSPRSSARSLSVSSASTNGPPSAAAAAAALQATAQQATHKKLGLGLKSAAERDKPVAPPASSAAPPAEVPPVQQQPARGMSSRATSMTSNVGPGLRGKLGLGSASSSSSSSSSSSTSSSSSSSTGGAPSGTAASGSSTSDDDASSALNKVAKPLPKHVLNRISGSSKEFPSPKLGGRSLGGLAGASSSSSSSSSAANSLTRSTRSPANTSDEFEAPTKLDADDSMSTDEDKPMTSTASGSVEGEDDEPVSSGISSSTEGQSDDADAGDEEMSSCSSSTGSEDDLLLKPRSKGPLSKLRDNVALPVTASPKQFRSSLALVALAANSANSNGSAVNPDADLVGPADPTTKPSSFSSSSSPSCSSSSAPPSFDAVAAASVQSHANILRENLLSSSSFSNSPKPAFLRRLDSPNTQYSKLMQAKIKLQSIINKAISEAPRMKAASAAEIRNAFEKAVNKLESSTTVNQANTDLKPLPL